MNLRLLLLAPWLGFSLLALPQYSDPESVEHDPAGDRYFVSNLGDGTIKQRDQAGIVTPFASVSPDPYGLEILGDTLYACSGGRVKGYLLADGSQVFDLNTGGGFLNGITTDGHYLYVTDFSGQKIFRVEPSTASFITWVASTGGTPNGIVYEPVSDALLVAYWGAGAIVRGYERSTASVSGNVSTGLGNIDGIAIECHGLVVISSWSPNRITRFEWGVVSPQFEDLAVPGLSQPADIDFDPTHDRICIPSGGNDQVILFDLADCATAVSGSITPAQVLSVALTDDGRALRFHGAWRGPAAYRMMDATGRCLHQGLITASDAAPLPHGAGVLIVQVDGVGVRRVVVP